VVCKNIGWRVKGFRNAQMHIEVILSFLLFMGAILAVFVFLNPLIKTPSPVVDINAMQEKIVGEISEKVGSISVITNVDGECYNFDSSYVLVYGNEYTEVHFLGTRKYVLYFSEFLEDSLVKNHDSGCVEDNYKFGIYKEEMLIPYSNVEGFIENYNLDYEGLRDLLQMGSEFRITFKNLEGVVKLSGVKNIPEGVEVNAQEFPISVIKNNGDVEYLILNIQVW